MSSEQIRKRRSNEEALLRELHFRGMLSRSELSRRLDIRKSSVTNIVTDMLERGILIEEHPEAPRSRVGLNGGAMRTLTAYLTPGEIRVSEILGDGTVSGIAREKTSRGTLPSDLLAKTAQMLGAELKAARLARRPMIGVGVAVPGTVDPRIGRGIHAVNLRQWKDIEAGRILEAELGIPVRVENDAHCQLLGNTWFRTDLVGYRNLLYVSLQEGVVAVGMVGGKVLSGKHFAAGEIGCLRAGSEGRRCTCGKSDCLQTYVSTPALVNSLNRKRPGRSFHNVAELASAVAGTEDPDLLGDVHAALEPLAPIVATMTAMLDPDAIVLATEDAAFSDLVRPLLESHLNREMLGLYAQAVRVVVADDVEKATLRGVASVLIRRAFRNGFEMAG